MMLTAQSPSYEYQVGGSLPLDAPSYIRRQADEQLYQALLNSELCYVLNSRQMGKSSLRVQTMHRLQSVGIRCGTIDITAIGTQQVTPEQWYASIVGSLVNSFRLKINVRTWWRDRNHLSLVNRLSEFIETVLLIELEQNIVIFIDEIDSVLGLKFPIDDFFAFIRACYNKRTDKSSYKRLTFALLGVATPGDLIADKNRTPFNIGRAIELKGFELHEAMPLLPGLTGIVSYPEAVLVQILNWTGGQPFLTQKLCKLVLTVCRKQGEEVLRLPPSDQVLWVEQLVREAKLSTLVESCIIKNWEANDQPEHLKTICDRLLRNEQRAGRLLGIYQQTLISLPPAYLPSPNNQSLSSYSPLDQEGWGNARRNLYAWGLEGVAADDSPEQMELLLSGLVVKRDGMLVVRNPIYAAVFNLDWVNKQLEKLRPYAAMLTPWLASGGQDESRLLRGQALRDALEWAASRSLSNQDYQFLAASQEFEQREVQQALEAERFKEVEARLIQEKKSAKRQRLLLFGVSGGLLLACGLGVATYFQYRRAVKSERQARISEIRALVSSSDGLFASNRRLDALIEAIQAKRRLQKLDGVDANSDRQVDNVLRQAVYETDEYNRLSGHKAAVLAVDISPDSSLIASASVDKTVKLWRRDGRLVATLKGHQAIIRAIAFSPDGQFIVSGSDDRTIKLWQRDGTLLRTLQGHTAAVWGVAFSPDGQQIISGGVDGTVKLWHQDGSLLKTLQGSGAKVWGVTFSPDGKLIAAASYDKTVKLWNRDGTLSKTLHGHTAIVTAVRFSPDGQTIASASGDKTIKLWTRDGRLLRTLQGHSASTHGIAWSPDSQMIASASFDRTVKLWSIDGTELNTLRGHTASVWGLAWSPDGSFIASAGAENVVRLWHSKNPFHTIVTAEQGGVWGINISSDSKEIATGTLGARAKLWNRQGKLLTVLPGNNTGSVSVAFSPDRRFIVSASSGNSVQLWQRDGTLVKTFIGHTAQVNAVAFSPQGSIVASGGEDNTVKLWRLDGTLLKTLTGHNATVYQVTFSPDGQTIASASADGTVKLWKLDGTKLRTLEGHQYAVWRVAFNHQGNIIASGSGDNTVKLWQLDGTLLRTLKGHTAAVWGVAFSPDDQIIASGSVDNTVKLWKLDGTELTTLRGHSAAIRGVAYSPDGTFVASVSEDNTLILWNLPRIFQLDFLKYGCDGMRDYLRTNKEVEESDRHLCDGIDK